MILNIYIARESQSILETISLKTPSEVVRFWVSPFKCAEIEAQKSLKDFAQAYSGHS